MISKRCAGAAVRITMALAAMLALGCKGKSAPRSAGLAADTRPVKESAADEAVAMKNTGNKGVSIFTPLPNLWFMVIRTDGGGYYGFGSGGSDVCPFPARTFDFEDLQTKLRSAAKFRSREKPTEGDCVIDFDRPSESPAGSMEIGPEFVRPIFGKARQAAAKFPSMPRMEQLWRERPPF